MKQRILLIEDEPGLVMTLSDRLTSEGYAVETAGDAESGLQKGIGYVRFGCILPFPTSSG